MSRASSKKPTTGGEKTPSGAPEEVERFARLFSGYSKAHGTFQTLKADETGKVKGKALTERGGATLNDYAAHLNGTSAGLGVIMLRDDDTCLFGAIDYDVKTMNHAKAEAKVRELGLPLILCRSKSGGGHFYVFLKDPVAAISLQDRLTEWTAMLGMAAKTEQFPKQATRFNDNDIGSWINLPYFNAKATNRYAVVGGKPIGLSQFLDVAEAAAVPSESFQSAERLEIEGTMFYEGPPCLQHLASAGGFPEGGRNKGMLAVITYLKKRYPDDWEGYVDQYNATLAKLPSTEVIQIVKSNRKKSYSYACKDTPINAHCQRRLCLGRMFGIGEGTPESKGTDITGLTRYDSAHGDDPMWRMEVSGKPVMISNSQFYSRDEFNRACMAQANVVPIHMPPQRWLRYLGEIITSADVVQMPEDAGPTGQLWGYVENFLTQQVQATEREEIFLGKPYREDGRVYFRSQDLFRYLDARKVQYKSPQFVYQVIRVHDATNGFWHVKDAGINWWSLPAIESPVSDEAPDLKFNTESF